MASQPTLTLVDREWLALRKTLESSEDFKLTLHGFLREGKREYRLVSERSQRIRQEDGGVIHAID
mgnify:CR=1 FL=1